MQLAVQRDEHALRRPDAEHQLDDLRTVLGGHRDPGPRSAGTPGWPRPVESARARSARPTSTPARSRNRTSIRKSGGRLVQQAEKTHQQPIPRTAQTRWVCWRELAAVDHDGLTVDEAPPFPFGNAMVLTRYRRPAQPRAASSRSGICGIRDPGRCSTIGVTQDQGHGVAPDALRPRTGRHVGGQRCQPALWPPVGPPRRPLPTTAKVEVTFDG